MPQQGGITWPLTALVSHGTVLVIAVLFASYHLFQLEGERTRRDNTIEQEVGQPAFELQDHSSTYHRPRVIPDSLSGEYARCESNSRQGGTRC